MHGYSMGYPWVVGQLPWAGNGYYIGTHGPMGMGNGQRPLPIGYPCRGLITVTLLNAKKLCDRSLNTPVHTVGDIRYSSYYRINSKTQHD